MGDLLIRRYRDADQGAVWELHNAALDAVGAHGGSGAWDEDLRRIGAAYLEAGGEFLVGELQGRIVAMGALQPTGPDRAKIRRMRVHPHFWRRGFGQAILQALEERARHLGFRSLWLDTTVGQVAAQRLYEKNGYARMGAGRHGSFVLVLYEKRLAPAGA